MYVPKNEDLSHVPEALLNLLGKLIFVMELHISPEQKLATEDPTLVLQNLNTQGYHLQMPPFALSDTYIS